MKTEFLIENIQKHISTLSKTIPANTQVPILSNLLLKATKEGFYILATDLEIGIQVKVPSKIIEEGTVSVAGKEFLEVLNSLPKDKVLLSKNRDKLEISTRSSKATFQTIPGDEFPDLFEEKGKEICKFSAKNLEETFSKIMFSTSTEDTRAELTGIYLFQKPQDLEVVTTDGYRLSLNTRKNQTVLEKNEGIILPSRIISEALAQKKETTLYISKKSNQVLFESEDIIIVGRTIHGNFPKYEKVIPTKSKTTIEIDREELQSAVKLSSIFARENSNIVKLSAENGRVKITSDSQNIGKQETEIDVTQKGEDVSISFNVRYIQDVLKVLDSKMIKIKTGSAQEPAVFSDETNKNYIHVIMPIRTKN